MDKAAPEETGAAAEKKRRLLRRVPTPLLVTLLGIGLSAWLLPAITRQWDDRQRAHDLKASLIEDMSTASARALVAGLDAIRTRQSASERLHRTEQDWQIAGVEVQAKLRAYFPQAVVQTWENYRFVMSAALWAAFHREVVRVTPSQFPSERQALLGLTELGKALGKGKSKFKAYGSRSDAIQGWALLDSDLELLEYKAEHDVLAAHPRGYSTTWRDLLHDLIP
jgi:hypothetical protein